MRTQLICAITLLILLSACKKDQPSSEALFTSEAFQVYADKIQQQDFSAKAISTTEIVSTYQSPANQFIKPIIDFKFSINGKDNEMPSGMDHHIVCAGKDCKTPLIVFGSQFKDTTSVRDNVYLQPDTRWTIQLDMREVFKQFDAQGFYVSATGAKIFKNDFKGVWIAGGTVPLTWDFDNLHNYSHLELKDVNGDHIYELTLMLNEQQAKRQTAPSWKLSLDVSAFPQYQSEYVLMDAMYNLSLEEMIRAVEKDSTLRTGKEWAGVWTRDVSYSIILSMAVLQPKVAQYSLMRKVKDGMIIQDTGTGGAYPISTDRMIWAVAAWEIYKVTGDRAWLQTAFPIIQKSLSYDLLNAIDPTTGLVKGESSFLDWREQTYPEWMQPADIFESQCLGTNAVHFQAHSVFAAMAKELGNNEVSIRHSEIAASIASAINKNLWQEDKGYYGQFLYGRNYKSLSPKSEALGEALCVLFDIADQSRASRIVSSTPVTPYGIPCIYPYIPNIPPYHNNGIWPFVQAYWTMAAAKTGNEKAVLESMSAIYRPASLFLTNKENFVAVSGDYVGTQINSDNMLWSLSGQIALVYNVIFGINYGVDGIQLRPFVPKAMQGVRTLKNFKYRNAILYFEMEGHGNVVESVTMDGEAINNEMIPATVTGKHTIKIKLANNALEGNVNQVENHFSLPAPDVKIKDHELSWTKVEGAVQYKVLENGVAVSTTTANTFKIERKLASEFQVVCIDSKGYESFASEPLLFVGSAKVMQVEMETFATKANKAYQGFSGSGFIPVTADKNTAVPFTVNVTEPGIYAIDFRYSNGNGPINTENKCAIRALEYNGKQIGTVVFPQRGTNEWSDWGYSNSVLVTLEKGKTVFTLTYKPHNVNMNGAINEAMIDYVRLVKIK